MVQGRSNDLLSRVKGVGGRSSLALATAPTPAPAPLDAPTPVAPAVPEPPAQTAVKPLESAPKPEVPAPAPPATPAPQPPVVPQQNTILTKLLGGKTPALAASVRGVITSIRLDKQLDSYIRKRYLKTGGKARLIDVVREALPTPVDPEVAQNGKLILAHRHKEFGANRASIEVPANILDSVNEEVERYATPSNILRPASLIELRLLTWASQQPDWPPATK